MSEDPTQMLPNDSTVLQQILTELRSLNARVQVVEERLDARSRETQPMSDRLDRLFAEVAASRQEFRDEIVEVRKELREDRLASHRALRMIDRTLQGIGADLALALDAEDDLHLRVTKLEEARESVKQ